MYLSILAPRSLLTIAAGSTKVNPVSRESSEATIIPTPPISFMSESDPPLHSTIFPLTLFLSKVSTKQYLRYWIHYYMC